MFQGGWIQNLTKIVGGQLALKTNDRFFITHSKSFQAIGHTEKSNRPVDIVSLQDKNTNLGTERRRRVILGDDLGSERYSTLVAKLDFCNVPFLKEYHIKPCVFAEYIFYPHHKNEGSLGEQLKQYSKLGVGFGFSVNLNLSAIDFSLILYHNILTLNPCK